MFGLYICGIAGALLAAYVLRRGVLKGGGGGFMMELPKYQMAAAQGRRHRPAHARSQIFLKRAGTIILGTTIILWALASIPQAGPGPEAERGLDRRPYRRRDRGRGRSRSASTTTSRLRLLPAMAAREVAVSAIATVYSIDLRDEPRPTRRSSRQAAAPLAAADRARLPRLVRVRSAVHLDHRGHAARDQRLEVAAVHGRLLFVLAYLAAGADLLDGGRARSIAVLKKRRVTWRA